MNPDSIIKEVKFKLASFLEKNRNSLPKDQLKEIQKALVLIDEFSRSREANYRKALLSEILLSLLRVITKPDLINYLGKLIDSLNA